MVCKNKWAELAKELEKLTQLSPESLDGAARCGKCNRPLMKNGQCVMGHAQGAEQPGEEPMAVQLADGLLCLLDESRASGHSWEDLEGVIYGRYALGESRRGTAADGNVEGWVLNVWGEEDYDEEHLIDRQVLWAGSEAEAIAEATEIGGTDWTLPTLRRFVEENLQSYGPLEGTPEEMAEAGIRAVMGEIEKDPAGRRRNDPRVRAARAWLQTVGSGQTASAERADVVLVMEGGVVQDFFGNDPNVLVTVIDHDQGDVGEDPLGRLNSLTSPMVDLDEQWRGNVPAEPAKCKLAHLVVVVEGGEIQNVFADDPGVRVTLVDHDEETGPLRWDRARPDPFSQLEQQYQDAILGTRGQLRQEVTALVDQALQEGFGDTVGTGEEAWKFGATDLDNLGLEIGEEALRRYGGVGEPLPPQAQAEVQAWLESMGVQGELALESEEVEEMDRGDLSEQLWGENLTVALGDHLLRLRQGVDSPELEGLLRFYRERVQEWDEPGYVAARQGAGGDALAVMRGVLAVLDEAESHGAGQESGKGKKRKPAWERDPRVRVARQWVVSAVVGKE